MPRSKEEEEVIQKEVQDIQLYLQSLALSLEVDVGRIHEVRKDFEEAYTNFEKKLLELDHIKPAALAATRNSLFALRSLLSRDLDKAEREANWLREEAQRLSELCGKSQCNHIREAKKMQEVFQE